MNKINKKSLEKRGNAKLLPHKSDFIPATYDKRGRAKKTLVKRPKKKPTNRSATTKKELAKLTAEWYDYIKSQGFEDIEWFDPKTGIGQDSMHLKGTGDRRSIPDGMAIKSMGSQDWVTNQKLHYSMVSNYLAHTTTVEFRPFARKTKGIQPAQLRYCLKLYSEGVSYRQIAAKLKTKAHRWQPKSYYWVFTQLQPILKHVVKWNKEDPEGLLNPRQLDLMAKEILIREPSGSSD